MPPTLYVLLFCFPHLISAGPQKTHPGNNLTDQLIAGTNSFIPSALNGLATVVEAGFESTEDEEHDDSDNGGETWQLEQFGGKWLIDGFETFSRILPLEREESNSAPIPVYGSSDRGQNMGRFDAAESPTGLEETDDHLQQQLEQYCETWLAEKHLAVDSLLPTYSESVSNLGSKIHCRSGAEQDVEKFDVAESPVGLEGTNDHLQQQLEQLTNAWLAKNHLAVDSLLPTYSESISNSGPKIHCRSGGEQDVEKFDAAESPTGLEETDDHLQQQLEQYCETWLVKNHLAVDLLLPTYSGSDLNLGPEIHCRSDGEQGVEKFDTAKSPAGLEGISDHLQLQLEQFTNAWLAEKHLTADSPLLPDSESDSSSRTDIYHNSGRRRDVKKFLDIDSPAELKETNVHYQLEQSSSRWLIEKRIASDWSLSNNGESCPNTYHRSGGAKDVKEPDSLDSSGGLEGTSGHRRLEQFAEGQLTEKHETMCLTLALDSIELDSGNFSNSHRKSDLEGDFTDLLNKPEKIYIGRQLAQLTAGRLAEKDKTSAPGLLMNWGIADSCWTPCPRWNSAAEGSDKKLDFMDLQAEPEKPCIYRNSEGVTERCLAEEDEISDLASAYSNTVWSFDPVMSLHCDYSQGLSSRSGCVQDVCLLTDCGQDESMSSGCGQNMSLSWNAGAKQDTAEFDSTDTAAVSEQTPISWHFIGEWLVEKHRTSSPTLPSDAEQNLNSGMKTRGADQGISKFDSTDMAFGFDTACVTTTMTTPFVNFNFHSDDWDLWASKPEKILRTSPGSVADQLRELQPTGTVRGAYVKNNQVEAVASRTLALPPHTKLAQSCATELHDTDPVRLSGNDFPVANFPLILPIQTNLESVLNLSQNSGDNEHEIDAFSSRTFADDGSGSDPFFSQSFIEDKSEAGIKLLGGPSRCNFHSKQPGDEAPGKLGREPLIPSSLEHVEIWTAGLATPPWLLNQSSANSQPSSPQVTISTSSTLNTSKNQDEFGSAKLMATLNEQSSFSDLNCGVCGEKQKYFSAFTAHLDTHNKPGEYRCNWLYCGTTVPDYCMLASHYNKHLPEHLLRKCMDRDTYFTGTSQSNVREKHSAFRAG